MARLPKIIKFYDDTRLSPFGVRWSIDGKRYSRFFKTEQEQDNLVREMEPFFNKSRIDILKLDSITIGEVLQIDRDRGETSFRDMWEFWKKHHKVQEVLTVFDACNRYIKDMKAKGENSMPYILHARKILERFCESFGERLVENITRIDLEDWLAALPFCAVTKKNYRSTLRAAWSFFERHELIGKNIAQKLQCQKIIAKEIEFLTVEEAERLMRANEKVDPEVCGLLALSMFAGMRTSAVCRVAYEEIDFQQRGILTPAEKTKKGRRNYIENLPDNLWAWLERTPETAFGWTERKWEKRKETAYRRAGLLFTKSDVEKLIKQGKKVARRVPPKNALRHSFASYHVAWKRDFHDTALILSHRGTDILFQHYKGNARKEDAERYFNIFPLDMLNK